MKFIICIILGWLILPPTTVHAASFNCEKATSNVEKHICGNAELSKMDEALNKAYQKALQRDEIKQKTIKSQRQWLKNQRNVCQSAECIKHTYESRINELGLTSSFGIEFMTPRDRNTSPPKAPAKLPESHVVAPSVQTPKTEAEQQYAPAAASPAPAKPVESQVVQQQISVSVTDCGKLTIPDSTMLPKSKLVSQLVNISRAKFEEKQFECAIQALEQASRVVHTVEDGVERAAMGFEIKDAFFNMIRKGTFADPLVYKRAILTAIQSIDANEALIKTASEDERFNDTAFFGRLADYYREHHRDDDYKQAIRMMYLLDFSLPKNRRSIDSSRMSQDLNTLLKKLDLLEIAHLWEAAPEDVRPTLEMILTKELYQPIHSYVFVGVKLLTYEKAKQDLEGLNKLQPAIEKMGSSPGGNQSSSLVWPIYRYMAEAYWQSGDKAKARQSLDKAHAIIQTESNSNYRANNLYAFSTSLCKYVLNNGKTAPMCPIGVYDAKEMSVLLDELQQAAKSTSDSHLQESAGVLRKRMESQK